MKRLLLNKIPLVAVICTLAGVSCRAPEPDETLETMQWSQRRLKGFSVTLPAEILKSLGVQDTWHVLHSTYGGFAVGSFPVSNLAVISDARRMLRGWDTEGLPRADVVCQLSTMEDIGRAHFFRNILICKDGLPVRGIEVITHVKADEMGEKIKSRLVEDQRIFEYILANIRKVENGKLVKPTIKMVGNGINRDRERAPNVMIQQLPQAIKLPDWAVDEAPAKDDPK